MIYHKSHPDTNGSISQYTAVYGSLNCVLTIETMIYQKSHPETNGSVFLVHGCIWVIELCNGNEAVVVCVVKLSRLVSPLLYLGTFKWEIRPVPDDFVDELVARPMHVFHPCGLRVACKAIMGYV